MMEDLIRQRMIVRQSSLKVATDLCMNEMPGVMIPVESLKALTNEIENFVMELSDTKPQTSLDPLTGKIVKKKILEM